MCVAVCCSMLQCVAVYFFDVFGHRIHTVSSTSQNAILRCVLQCVAVCCSVFLGCLLTWNTHSLLNIAEYNFNRSYSGKNACAYGDGVYFAKSGNFSYRSVPISMCMYIYMYTNIYTHIRMCIYIYMYPNIYTHVRMCMYTYMYTNIYTHVRMCM